jgi:large subunit ribosomal protein L6
MNLDVHPDIGVTMDDRVVTVTRSSDEPQHRALHGLTRMLVANMVEGVVNGFSKTLEIQGVGYRAMGKGSGIELHLGFSHTIQYPAPDGVSLDLPDQTTIVVSGVDKQKVGQAAAEIRGFRPPEPYKGKGIRYKGEHVRRKAGKTAGA